MSSNNNNNNKDYVLTNASTDGMVDEEVLMMQAAEEVQTLAYEYATNGTQDLSEDEIYLVMESLVEYFNYKEELHHNNIRKKANNS